MRFMKAVVKEACMRSDFVLLVLMMIFQCYMNCEVYRFHWNGKEKMLWQTKNIAAKHLSTTKTSIMCERFNIINGIMLRAIAKMVFERNCSHHLAICMQHIQFLVFILWYEYRWSIVIILANWSAFCIIFFLEIETIKNRTK